MDKQTSKNDIEVCKKNDRIIRMKIVCGKAKLNDIVQNTE